jgi:hypothetical protein
MSKSAGKLGNGSRRYIRPSSAAPVFVKIRGKSPLPKTTSHNEIKVIESSETGGFDRNVPLRTKKGERPSSSH